MEQAVLILQGNYKQVAGELRAQMETAADKLQFELAASLRDRLRAVESLGEKQLVTAGTMANTDVIGYYQNETRACFAVLHYVNGSLLDKEYEILATADDPKEAVSSLVKQFYLVRGAAPKVILTPFEMEDAELFSALLQQELGKKVLIRMPQRGDNVRLVELAQKNAREEAERITTKAERRTGTLGVLADMLHLPDTPHRMESYDISNLAGTDIVASMVVFQDGKPLKSAYKRFKVEGLTDQDDYASMHQVLLRRLTHYVQQDAGFAERPDVLLIDGGIEHARVAEDVLQTLGLSIPTYGMVKDDRHRTRALVTAAGDEIAISAVPSVFALIGTIQEETHRFAITYQRTLRSRRMKASGLEDIPGIGEKRRQALLKKFRSVKAISQAGQAELEQVLPVPAAQAVYRHFHPQEGGTACASSQEPPEASR